MHTEFLAALSRSVAIGATAAFLFLPAGMSTAVHAQNVTAQVVSEFLANPNSLLTANPDGGSQLVSRIRDLVLANPATLPIIIALLTSANPAQQAAIGSGLGQAANAVVQSNPTLAAQIQEQLAASGVQIAIAAYSAVTGNVVTAAGGGTGGGGGDGGGGIGGPINITTPTGGGGGSGGGGAAGGTASGGGGLTGGGGVSGGGGDATTGGSVSPS